MIDAFFVRKPGFVSFAMVWGLGRRAVLIPRSKQTCQQCDITQRRLCLVSLTVAAFKVPALISEQGCGAGDAAWSSWATGGREQQVALPPAAWEQWAWGWALPPCRRAAAERCRVPAPREPFAEMRGARRSPRGGVSGGSKPLPTLPVLGISIVSRTVSKAQCGLKIYKQNHSPLV